MYLDVALVLIFCTDGGTSIKIMLALLRISTAVSKINFNYIDFVLCSCTLIARIMHVSFNFT